MSTANKGRIPLAQVAQVVLELAKSKKKLEALTQELKCEKDRSRGFWRDRKGDEFRGKVQEIIALNTQVGEVMLGQVRTLRNYYAEAEVQEKKTRFDGGNL